jgi:hypothetical protein
MAETVGDAVDRCLNTWLSGTFSTQQNAVKTGIDGSPTTTEIECLFPLTGVATGAFVAIENELCYIVDTDQTNNRLVVVRGQRGTKPAGHIAGTTLEVNPRYPRYMIRAQMQADVEGWPRSLFNIQHFTADIGISDTTITIPASINGYVPRRVLGLRRKSLSPTDSRYRRTQGYATEWDLLDQGNVIMLDENWGWDRTFAARVACGFNTDALNDDDNDLRDDVGLGDGMREVMELGAAWRLLMGRGAVRLFPESEGQSRVPSEVGTQDIPRLAVQYRQLQQMAMESAADLLIGRAGFGGT